MTNTMSIAEAMAKAREYDKKHEDIPSVSRTLADEVERLDADAAGVQAELASVKLENERLQGIEADYLRRHKDAVDRYEKIEQLRVALANLLEIEDARIESGAFKPNEEARRRIDVARALIARPAAEPVSAPAKVFHLPSCESLEMPAYGERKPSCSCGATLKSAPEPAIVQGADFVLAPPGLVTVPALPTGPLTPELQAECKRRCEEAGLVFEPAVKPGASSE